MTRRSSRRSAARTPTQRTPTRRSSRSPSSSWRKWIDKEVLIAEGPGYARVSTSKGLAPSPGPKPVGGGTGSGGGSGAGAANEIQSITDELLANEVAQDVIDTVLAVAPQGDATEGLATESPDAIPVDGEPDIQVPKGDLA